jgi:hypothetical protein
VVRCCEGARLPFRFLHRRCQGTLKDQDHSGLRALALGVDEDVRALPRRGEHRRHALLSPATRLLAAEMNATRRPWSLIDGSALRSSASVPEFCLICCLHREPRPNQRKSWQLVDLQLLLWALVGSNHRPPPCKGASRQARYLGKRPSTQVRTTSGFECLWSRGASWDTLCVLFAYYAFGSRFFSSSSFSSSRARSIAGLLPNSSSSKIWRISISLSWP